MVVVYTSKRKEKGSVLNMRELRTFNTYTDMQVAHQKDINEFPFIFAFAFSEDEFVKKLAEKIKERKPQCTGITTMEGIKKHIVGIGAGGYVFKEDVNVMNEMFKLHEEERKAFTESENNLVSMILYEMNNHEYGYTRDPYDTLMCLGKTYEDLETDEKFSSAWNKAKKKCFDAFDECN